MGALLADRAEKQPGEAAVPSRPDDQEIVLSDRADEHVAGVAVDDPALDLEAVDGGSQVGDQLLEQLLGRAVNVAEAGAGQGLGRAADLGIAVARPARAEEAGRRCVNDPQWSPA